MKRDSESLEANQAGGPENIGNNTLKNLPALNNSFSFSKLSRIKVFFLSLCKISEGIPFYKEESKAMIEQYCRINLLFNVSKVLEKLIFNDLIEIVKTTLHNTQHFFSSIYQLRHILSFFYRLPL